MREFDLVRANWLAIIATSLLIIAIVVVLKFL